MKTVRIRTKKNKSKIPNLSTVNHKLFIGIDNGVTGTIGCIFDNKSWFFETPVKIEQNYTKAKGNISRVVFKDLFLRLWNISIECNNPSIMCLIERPMINPGRFKASISGVRALETTLDVIEELEIPYQYEDSKAWQKELLPKGVKGDAALKAASKTIGCRLFPQHSELITKHKDADGMLLAEFCRRIF